MTIASSAVAQIDWRSGYVTGGFETNSIYYLNDATTNAVRPDGRIGSNNYLKVDFGVGLLEGGLQMEGYFPSLQGYPSEMDGYSLATKYIRYRKDNLAVTVGDFYEQLGSGLLFRAYEERSLGVNTAIEGAHVSYNWDGKVGVKGFVGVPKLFRKYNYDSRIIGTDLSADITALAGVDGFGLTAEGSFLSKHQGLDSEWQEGLITPNVNGYSGRLVFDIDALTLKGEYITRDADVSRYNNYNTTRSKAVLLEASYTYGNLGTNLTFRKLKNAGFQSDFNQATMYTGMNYIPALTQQHTYSLAALNPYQSQMEEEIGGQEDVYYFFPRRSVIGGLKGMRLHGNFSTYYGPSPAPEIKANELYFRDLTVDAERWFGKQIKATALYTWQTYNNRVSPHPVYEFRQSHVVVADVTYKFNDVHALRGEYQHLWSAKGDGNWCAGALEYTISPGWSFSVADMWNYGYTRIHYPNGGVSYSKSHVRAQLNFGRFREGYQCAGGVCRLIPAYTGGNFNVTISF